jgi:hypothetical protein
MDENDVPVGWAAAGVRVDAASASVAAAAVMSVLAISVSPFYLPRQSLSRYHFLW